MKRSPTVLALVMLAWATAPAYASGGNPCATERDQQTSGWRVYVDSSHRFCFRYPKSYRPVMHRIRSCQEPALRDKNTNATIYVCASPDKFEQSTLLRGAPTGIEAPPEPIPFGPYVFHYYGPGGGGVAYPDAYYYDLRGKILFISFDGPYVNDKTPTAAAKRMERKVLGSFRRF